MSDLPLLPVYLAGTWPAASWYIRQLLDSRRHPERHYKDDGEEVARDAFLVALDDQLRVGADIVTTNLGLPGVVEGISILERIQGLETLPSRKQLSSRLYHGQPIYQQTKPLLALRGLGVATDAERLMSLSSTLSVSTLLGPYTLASLIQGGQGRVSMAMSLATLLRGELESLVNAGVMMVQLDETGFAWAPDEPSVLADLVRRTVDGIPIEVHLRLGYLDGYGRPMGRRKYRPWLVETTNEVVNATINVRQFDLAFGAMEMNEVDVLADLPARRIGLGIVDSCNTWVEPATLLAERIREAKKYVPAERLWITADAGMAALSRNVAIRKVNSMVEAARTVRQELGVREATGTPSSMVVTLPIPEPPPPQPVASADYMGL
jgi:5-methyltetrahydropteroyltriglutamate--homocysteine methyltransferase